MPRIDWDRQVGRRLKLRDLHVFLAVARRGSMAKAAVELNVSQPVVSEVIAGPRTRDWRAAVRAQCTRR